VIAVENPPRLWRLAGGHAFVVQRLGDTVRNGRGIQLLAGAGDKRRQSSHDAGCVQRLAAGW
jgi:hypothetical protein